MDYENVEKGISLKDILKIMFGRKLILLITTVSFMIIGILFITLYYNKNNTRYNVEFSYNSTDLNSGVYADGSIFDYSSLINIDTLEEIKDSDPKFNSIDTTKLYNSGALSIEKKVVDENISYKISVGKRYLNQDVYKEFILAICNYPINKMLDMISKYDNSYYLTSFDDSTSYTEKTNLLSLQLEMLKKNYTNLIKKYNDVSVDGVKISVVLDDIESYFTEHDIEYLDSQVKSEGFVYSNSVNEKQLSLKKNTLEVEYAQNESIISALQDKISDLVNLVGTSISELNLNDYNKEIVDLTIENSKLTEQIKMIEKQITNLNSTDETYLAKKSLFDSTMNLYYQKLKDYTQKYTRIEKEVANNNSKVIYTTSNMIQVTGGINVVVSAFAFAFIGLLIGFVINVALDYKKAVKEEKNDDLRKG